MPVALVQRNGWTVPSMSDREFPTTTPALLIPLATLATYVPRLPTSTTEPFGCQSTACAPPGAMGGMAVLSQRPEAPTTWPESLMPNANETVSPGKGLNWRMLPVGCHTTAW